jgi:hypothetical protein
MGFEEQKARLHKRFRGTIVWIERYLSDVKAAREAGRDLNALLGVTQQRFTEMLVGLEDLNARQGRALEKKTGRSVAELAVMIG